MSEHVLTGLTAIVVLGVVAQWLAWRIRIPSILLLLLSGFLVGPVAGFLHPDELFGPLLLPVVSLSVALILYEGGLTLRVSDLPRVGGVVRNLVTIGVLITWAVGAAASWWLFDLTPALAVLLGALLVVTGPTVILPMLHFIRPTGSTGPILKWEGIVVDPIGALMAVLVFEAITGGSAREATASLLGGVMKTALLGGGLGLVGAAVLTLFLYKFWIPEGLQNAVSLMFVVGAFTASNAVQHESGLVAVTVMGIALANQKYVDVRHIVEFKENLRVLLISGLFIVLAARLDLAALQQVVVPGVSFVLLLALLARPLSVWVSTLRSTLSRAERLFLSSMAPRGIVAAATASVFAIRLEQLGYEQASLLVPITFVVIIGTVLLYGVFSPMLARRLGVADAEPQGILFVGADRWSRMLATFLQEKGFKVMTVDTNREHTAAARMAGLATYTGSVLSEYALDEIDLGGIGRLFAVTPNEMVNALAVQRFTRLFGRAECYQLAGGSEDSSKQSLDKHLKGRALFGPDVTHWVLQHRVSSGAVVKATHLTEEFDFDVYRKHYGEDAVPLLLLDEEEQLSVITVDQSPEPQPGQTIISIVKDEPVADDTGRRT